MRIRDAVLAAGLGFVALTGALSSEAAAGEPARGSVWYVQASSLAALNSYIERENTAPKVERVSLQTVLEITHNDNGNFVGRAVQYMRGSKQYPQAQPQTYCLRVIGSVSKGIVQFGLVGLAMTNRGDGHGVFTKRNGRDFLEVQFSRISFPNAVAQKAVMAECKPGEGCNTSVPGGGGKTIQEILALCPANAS
ncbi:hypothetical protein [Methylobrevis albus]|uniref:Uncharacterized protein n=1 Tax=Methylobrevis albus TaxID=2793297 RepID=A0A931I1C1_9HYPH|nr:hypothetical protein [Methylobrevis albus]MBH0237133.1 hypothetical protein [Methylobrevis albus]